MILKGTAIRNRQRAVNLANHLLKANDNDICEVVDIDGHARPDDLRAALVDYYDMVNLTNGDTGLFMVSINPEVGEKMTAENYSKSIAKIEELFNLEGLPKAIVRHHKQDREHYHVVWQTTNTDTKQIQAQIFRYNVKCKNLSRELERDFGHRVLSNDKSKTAYNEKERNQATRTASKLKPDERKKLIQKLYSRANDRNEFAKSLEKNGLTLATGKVGICLVDKSSGQVYNLEKELGKKIDQIALKEFLETEKHPLPDASKVASSLKTNSKLKEKELKSKSQGKNREPKYRLKEKGIPQELDNTSFVLKAEKFAENSKNIQESATANLAQDFAYSSQEATENSNLGKDSNEKTLDEAQKFSEVKQDATADPKEVFKQKLKAAQENMKGENDNDLSREKKKESTFKKFKDNSLETLLPLIGLGKLILEQVVSIYKSLF